MNWVLVFIGGMYIGMFTLIGLSQKGYFKKLKHNFGLFPQSIPTEAQAFLIWCY